MVPRDARNGVERLDIALVTYAKRQRNHQFLVLNELLACRLGEAMQLPVAQGVPVIAPTFENGEATGEDTYWGSLAVREDPPPADCELLVERLPELAMGVIVFDAWILNIDRHEGNLAFDQQTDQITLFDHGEALCNGEGPSFMRARRDKIGFENGSNAIAIGINSWNFLDRWLSKLAEIDSQFIATTVRTVAAPYLSIDDAIELAFEIDRRRRTLWQLFDANATKRDIFPSITDIFPAVDSTNDVTNFQI